MNQRHWTSWVVIGLLLLASTLTLTQIGVTAVSYGQYMSQTTFPPGFPSTWHSPTGDRTWTRMGNRTWTWVHTGDRNFTWAGNMTWRSTGNQSWTWTHTGNQTWIRPGNMTDHKRRADFPIFLNGWAQSNITVGARNITQPILMNGTQLVRLDSIIINASSSNQNIRNVAMNTTVVQVEFDRNGSLQLMVKSSVKPSFVLADNIMLTEAQTLQGLTPSSEAWVYDPISHTLTILADPSSVTLIYPSTPISTPLPEYSMPFAMVLTACLTSLLLFERLRKSDNQMTHVYER